MQVNKSLSENVKGSPRVCAEKEKEEGKACRSITSLKFTH